MMLYTCTDNKIGTADNYLFIDKSAGKYKKNALVDYT